MTHCLQGLFSRQIVFCCRQFIFGLCHWRSCRLAAFLSLLAWPIFEAQPLLAEKLYDAKVAVSQQQYSKALELLDFALVRNPQNGDAFFYKAYIFEKQGNKEQANEMYMQAVDTPRMDSELREKAFWKVVLYLDEMADWDNLSIYAGKFLHVREFDHVLKLQEKAILNASLASPRVRETLIAYRQMIAQENFTAAAKLLESRIRELPNPEYLRWQLAQLYMREREYARATPHLKYLQKRISSRWKYGYKLAVCYYQIGKYNESLSAIKKSRKANSSQSEKFLLYTKILEGKNYIRLGKYHKALLPLEETAAANSKSLVHQIDLGETYFFLGMFPKANTQARILSLQRYRKERDDLSWEMQQRALLHVFRMEKRKQQSGTVLASTHLLSSKWAMAARGIAVSLKKKQEQEVAKDSGKWVPEENVSSKNLPDYYEALVVAGQSYGMDKAWKKAESIFLSVDKNKLSKHVLEVYYLHYAHAVFRARKASRLSLNLLGKTKKGEMLFYVKALCLAELRATKKTIVALNEMRSLDKKRSEKIKKTAKKEKKTSFNFRPKISGEPVFRTLAQEDPEFQKYLSTFLNNDS